MLARFLSAAIILFWITMTVLLVRSELWPGQSTLRSVPIEHVAKLFWQHQQASDLSILRDNNRVGHLHLRHLNPLPRDLGEVLARYDHVLIPEMNLGQLAFLVRAKFLRDVVQLDKVQGQPFKESEILSKIEELAPAKEGVRA